MGNTYILCHNYNERLETDYFVKQLTKMWPDVQTHFDSESKPFLPLQFSIPTIFWFTGDFAASSVGYFADKESDIAAFALWYRSIIPNEWTLSLFDTAESFEPMLVTNKTTPDQIIHGFEIPLIIPPSLEEED